MRVCEVSLTLYRLAPFLRGQPWAWMRTLKARMHALVRRAYPGALPAAVLIGLSEEVGESLLAHVLWVGDKANFCHATILSRSHDLSDNFIAGRFICTQL